MRLLVDAGADPDRYNQDGYHAHSTPLHRAIWYDHRAVVTMRVDRGARVDIRDTTHLGTPVEWAMYGNRTAIAEYLDRMASVHHPPPKSRDSQ